MRFTWIPFYKEFAEKIMHYRNDRKSLLDIIYANDDSLIVNYLHDNKGEGDLCKDIDPFTTLGIFNRGITEDNRKVGAEKFKELLSIEAEAPSDFTGIPILNNQMSHFFGFRNKREKDDIENLWKLFEKVVRGEDFKSEYDTVIRQYIINVNITMGLFWIRPEEYLALDKTNNTYMKDEYGIDLPKKVPSYDDYMSLLQMIKEKMATNEIKENTFYEISANAAGAMDSIDNEGTWYDDIVETWKKRKNIVLYGAPGTGKTYDVPEFVVRLCQPEFDANNAEREDLMKVYNQLKQEKRVAFTTFHQSMDYEDWMEGLKPVVDNNQVTYEIDRGIFKILCEEAERPIVKNKQIGIASDAVVWKVSLQGTGDNPVRKECMDNGHIRIGWDDYGAVISDETDWTKHNGEGKQILDAFINKMKEGDIIMSCYTNRTIDAIGVVVGDYEFDNSYDHYKRVRKVNWLLKDINENIVEMNNGKTMTLGTVYRLNAITLDKVKALLDKHKTSASMEDNTKPYVMVIDELNRGNVSKIFGELITLLEADKRKGHKNAESVILPYSKVQFMVPDNVYIIATMNTADRSLGNLDYAIRRRFAFIADKPYSLEGEVPGFNEELFHKVSDLFITNYDEYKDSGWLQTLPLKPADTLSEEYKPEDVWIGHSYFIMKDEDGTDITTDRLLYEIIPLLEEYVRDGVLTEDVYSIIEELRNIANE
ncbi:AAA family ATPase [Prevotella loescheii]|nr:AAA family ATPase [Hoylesella loescheii]